MKCEVANCKNVNDSQACNKSFFVFPANKDLKKKWVSFCRREKSFNPQNGRICMLHFKPQDIENGLQYDMGFAKHRVLKRGVVPTIYTDAIENVELSAQRSSRIEKRENKKIVKLLLKKSYAENAAERQQEVEVVKAKDGNLGCFDASETCNENVQSNSDAGDESITSLKVEIHTLGLQLKLHMSLASLCRLCMNICGLDRRSLYHEDGHENEMYELMIKYFDPKCFFSDKEYHLTAMCFECWKQILSFHNFQQSVYQAQKHFFENCNTPNIKSEMEFPQEKSNIYMAQTNQLFSHHAFSAKSEDEVQPEEVSIFNSGNVVGGFTITEVEGLTKPNHDKLDDIKPKDSFLSLNRSRTSSTDNIHRSIIHDKEERTISLPKLELTDVYSGDDSSQDPLSDEYDDPEDASLGGEFSDKDDSMDLPLPNTNSKCLISKHLQTRKGSTVSLKDSDDFIAQWKPSLQCELCSEACSTYSLLRQHFHDKHPLEKCYIICCQQMFSRRYRIEDHIRLHMDPNAFKCELCEKDHTSRYYLISHMRTHHLKSIDPIGKTCKKTRITDKEMDELIAQWMPNLECVVCKKMCSTLKLLQLHFRQTHPQKQFQIECCQRKFKRRYEIEEHIRLHIDPNAFKCELCYKQFKEGRYLHAHMRSFHSKLNESKRKNAYQKKMTDTEMDELIAHDDFAAQVKSCLECVLCSEMCPTYSLLRQHFQNKHPQEKFYILCCQQKFSLRYRIEDHVRLHINPNVFKCDLCDRQFKEGRYLLAHKRSHHADSNDGTKKSSNKKMRSDKEIDDLISQWSPNLVCVVCSKTYTTLTLLQMHFRQNHPQKQFQIECCQRMFKRRYEIEEHMRLHIDPDAFKCELCSTRFSMRRNLLQHMSSKHPSSESGQIS